MWAIQVGPHNHQHVLFSCVVMKTSSNCLRRWYEPTTAPQHVQHTLHHLSSHLSFAHQCQMFNVAVRQHQADTVCLNCKTSITGRNIIGHDHAELFTLQLRLCIPEQKPGFQQQIQPQPVGSQLLCAAPLLQVEYPGSSQLNSGYCRFLDFVLCRGLRAEVGHGSCHN